MTAIQNKKHLIYLRALRKLRGENFCGFFIRFKILTSDSCLLNSTFRIRNNS